ncbi:putative bifunctional diguanylate cyclase/phosphodiesterase [Thiocapsa bogorovii]|uniref:putative bifunctional diguanylate cyclase/phosphodiesterase n=1 Tax=Thiocapsa bogorovii TaxID=521689 RepID=UPI001E5E4BD9|nr:EAL domain-containing protein [Thiocapsa bogorovii]UHD17678.1 EAL domain-containing protein [Thiocapsa bogorovii]
MKIDADEVMAPLHAMQKATAWAFAFFLLPSASAALVLGRRLVRDETTIAAQQARYRAMLDSMNDGVALYRPRPDGSEFVLIDINPAAQRIAGVARREDVIGLPSRIAFSGLEAAGIYAAFGRVHRHGRRETVSLAVYDKGPSRLWLESDVIRLEGGEILSVFKDITARRAADERIEHLAHQDSLTGLVNRRNLEILLRQALHSAHREGRRLAVLFIDLDRFKVINDTLGHPYGMEAIVRWHHPRRGLLTAGYFIPIAEESGLIHVIGEWVLNAACRRFGEWKQRGLGPQRIAVNLSAHQLRDPTLIDTVSAVLRRYDINDNELELEVTETVAMRDPRPAVDTLQALRGLGVALAIDDFGTGHSSLAYLKHLPIQTLKLDREFVRDIENDENDAAISAATLALAHELGLRVVAEGIETEGQSRFLQAHGCDLLQGYFYGRPEPAEVWTARWSEGESAELRRTRNHNA